MRSLSFVTGISFVLAELCSISSAFGQTTDAVGLLRELNASVEVIADPGGDEYLSVTLKSTWQGATDDLRLLSLLGDVRELELRKVRIEDESLRLIAEIESLRTLKLLRIGDVSPAAMLDLRQLDHLARLDLMGDTFTDDVMASIAECDSLEVLNLANARVSDNGIRRLSSLTSLIELSHHPGYTRSYLTDASVPALLSMTSLKRLSINARGMTSDGLLGLAAHPGLNYLSLSVVRVTPELVERLATQGSVENLYLYHCWFDDLDAILQTGVEEGINIVVNMD